MTPRTPVSHIQKGGIVFATLVFASTYLLDSGGNPGNGRVSYDLRVFRVVENQPFSLGGSTNILPVQAWWFDQRVATLALLVEKSTTGHQFISLANQ